MGLSDTMLVFIEGWNSILSLSSDGQHGTGRGLDLHSDGSPGADLGLGHVRLGHIRPVVNIQ